MGYSKDYYAILGVLPTAEDIVIRAAYKALAQRYHPDTYNGSPEEANRRIVEINEAYSVLRSKEKREEYDNLRGSGTQEGNSFFRDESEDSPPSYDPLENDWAVVCKYYDDLKGIESRLSKISWRLAYSFRAYILEEKAFDLRKNIAAKLEQQFLELYFGKNPDIVQFARRLVMAGKKVAAKELNNAIRILGTKVDPYCIINQIIRDHFPTEADLLSFYGLTFDGEHYLYQKSRYEKLEDAIAAVERNPNWLQ